MLLGLALPASATTALVQHPAVVACGTSVTTCTLTVSALGIGNFAAVVCSFANTTGTMSSMTGGGTNWVRNAGSRATDTTAAVGIEAMYQTVLTVADTSVVVTFNAAQTGARCQLVEYSHTLDVVMLDTVGSRDQSSAVTNPAGVTLTLATNGSDETIVQYIVSAGTVSAISGSYTNPADFSTTFGVAGVINTNSGTAPTWTTTSGRAALGALAFREINNLQMISKMDGTPYLRQSHVPSASQGSTVQTVTDPYNFPVVSGNLLVVWYTCASTTLKCLTGPTVSDSLGSTWTSRATQGSTQCGHLWIYTATAASSGDDLVTVTVDNTGFIFPEIAVAEYGNATNTVDVASTVTGYSASTDRTTPSVTPNTDGALLLSGMNTCTSIGTAVQNPAIGAGTTQTADGLGTGWQLAGLSGSGYTHTYTLNSSTTGNLAMVAMKAASALQVTTKALADASTSAAYSATLNSNGGSGAVTWSQIGGHLPTGLSLNTSTGEISGTPTTGNSVEAMTFRATDGASATADSITLTITVGTSLNTPAFVQGHANATCAFSLGTVTAGNLILITYVSTLTGYDEAVFTDTLGTVYSPLPIWAQTQSANQPKALKVAWGFATSTGAATLNCSGLRTTIIASEISGVQQIFDASAVANNNGSGGASPITSGTITAPVAGMLFSTMLPVTNTATIGAGTGFTLGTNSGTTNKIVTEYNASGVQGSNTSTFTETSNTDGHWFISLLNLRPSISGTAPNMIKHRGHVM
jgi:hypothetical protein